VGVDNPYSRARLDTSAGRDLQKRVITSDDPNYIDGQIMAGIVDGMQVSYSMVMSALINGSAVQCPNNYCGSQTVVNSLGQTVITPPFQADANGWSGYNVPQWGNLGVHMQDDGANPLSPPPLDPQDDTIVGWDFVDASQSGDPERIPLPDNFKDLIKERLGKKDCNTFISKMIAQVVKNYNKELEDRNKKYNIHDPEYKADGTDGFDLLEKISKQNGFVLDDHLMVDGQLAGGTVVGSIKGGDAEVKILSRFVLKIPGFDVNKFWTNHYISSAIHEMIHLAGNGVFTDQDLARAAYDLGENKNSVEPNFNPKKVFKYSSDWNWVLMKHCGGN
jgi:hypothetical protein